MPITPYLSGRTFEPETIKCMGQAFEAVCSNLGLRDKADPICEMVAQRVIAYTQAEDSDPSVIAERVLRSLSRP
jgi:hypothetical protein